MERVARPCTIHGRAAILAAESLRMYSTRPAFAGRNQEEAAKFIILNTQFLVLIHNFPFLIHNVSF